MDGVFFGIGHEKLQQILQSPAAVTFVGFPDKNVWQDRVSIQIKIEDLKLVQPAAKLQVLDQRIQKLTVDLFKKPGTFAFFEQKVLQQVSKYIPSTSQTILLPAKDNSVETPDLFLIDCPKDLRDLQSSLGGIKAQRIHMIFYHKHDLMANGMPSRQQFAALYRFIVNHHGLNLRRDKDKMAQYLNLSKELMIFMFQVFFEVGFVKIENGLITSVPVKQQINLKETSSYHSRRLQVRTQKILLHSKSADLVKWIKEQSS